MAEPRKLYINNQVEESLVELELAKIGLKTQFFPANSGVFGAKTENLEYYGYFEVSADDYPMAKEIYENILESTTEVSEAPISRKTFFTLTNNIFLGIIVVLGATAIYFETENQRLAKSNHYAEALSDYIRKWNPERTILSRYLKDGGTLEAEFFDEGKTGKWEKERFYDKHGVLREEYFSSKNDGFFDKDSLFDAFGNLTQAYLISKEYDRAESGRIFLNKATYIDLSALETSDQYYSAIVVKDGIARSLDSAQSVPLAPGSK